MEAEGVVTLTIHGLTLTAIGGVFAILLKEHTVVVRIKERVNQLWFDRCKAKGDNYTAVEDHGD